MTSGLRGVIYLTKALSLLLIRSAIVILTSASYLKRAISRLCEKFSKFSAFTVIRQPCQKTLCWWCQPDYPIRHLMGIWDNSKFNRGPTKFILRNSSRWCGNNTFQRNQMVSMRYGLGMYCQFKPMGWQRIQQRRKDFKRKKIIRVPPLSYNHNKRCP